eukprot:6202828-Pleurochrysis_carterae.AAC.2
MPLTARCTIGGPWLTLAMQQKPWASTAAIAAQHTTARRLFTSPMSAPRGLGLDCAACTVLRCRTSRRAWRDGTGTGRIAPPI